MFEWLSELNWWGGFGALCGGAIAAMFMHRAARKPVEPGVFVNGEKWIPNPSLETGGFRIRAQEAMHLIQQMTPEQRSAHLRCFGGVSFPVPGLKYHGKRDDGVYVPICVFDPRGESGEAEAVLAECRQESTRLRAEGHTVED